MTNDKIFYPTIHGAEIVCTLPKALGAVTKLVLRNGKVIAETESGIKVICLRPVKVAA